MKRRIAWQPGEVSKSESSHQDTAAIAQDVLNGPEAFWKKSSGSFDKTCTGNVVVGYAPPSVVSLPTRSEDILEPEQNYLR